MIKYLLLQLRVYNFNPKFEYISQRFLCTGSDISMEYHSDASHYG